MDKQSIVTVTNGSLLGLLCIYRYRFLTGSQFARVSGFSLYHARETLRRFAERGLLGSFGFTGIPGQGKTPKVYYLTKKGFGLLLRECDCPEELTEFQMVNPDVSWSPKMYHRLALIDLFTALEANLKDKSAIVLSHTFLEYRRVSKTQARETTDYVGESETSLDRIVPDGAFILENRENGRRGLFFVEMDMGTERIATNKSPDTRATILGKFQQYDRYLTSGRFARTYSSYGDFASATILFVTTSPDRVENMRKAAGRLPGQLHGYYRLSENSAALADFLGPVWKSREPADTQNYALVRKS
jgi:hypothetical protein